MTAPPSWLLALHSSSDTLGVGLQALPPLAPVGELDDPSGGSTDLGFDPPRLASFPLGRALGNDLLSCVETLLPADQWPQLGRLVVATGPGGFTGTRLTVVLARTLAQQLGIPLHGFSSFLLMARRRIPSGGAAGAGEGLWLTQALPRRGMVAGCYGADVAALGGVAEWQTPRLFPPGESLPAEPAAAAVVEALVEAEADVAQLLQLGQLAQAQALPGPWAPVLPLYPTSPVEARP